MASNNPQDKSGRTEVAPAKGKLGVMIPGMGAVATTFVAGVEAVRKGISSPIGSVTQMGTIRLGKRTDGRSPKVKDFVPLAGLVNPSRKIPQNSRVATAGTDRVIPRSSISFVAFRHNPSRFC